MTDENIVFDAAFEYQMSGMSPEAAAEAGAHSDSQDARIEELEGKLKLAVSALDAASEYSSGLKSYADNLRASLKEAS
jgi:hypothetical protein